MQLTLGSLWVFHSWSFPKIDRDFTSKRLLEPGRRCVAWDELTLLPSAKWGSRSWEGEEKEACPYKVSRYFYDFGLKCFFLPPPPTSKLQGKANLLYWMVHVTYPGPLHELFLGPHCQNPQALALESLHLSIQVSLHQHTSSMLDHEKPCYFLSMKRLLFSVTWFFCALVPDSQFIAMLTRVIVNGY